MPGYPRPQTVPATPLDQLGALLTVPVEASANVTVTGITHASDEVRPGDLYAALPGARRHGAEFIAAAAAAGAVAVLTDPAGADRTRAAGLPALVVADPRTVLGVVASRIYGDPTRRLTVIGITGTAGKTSTAYLIESGLRAAGRTTGLIGTVETRLGDLTIESARTTPEATDLHASLAVAVERGVDAVVMEVSSHALALGRVGGVRFAVGGFTNLGLDHLDFHAGVDDYFAAKARLFDGRCAVEIVNVDDEYGRRLVRPHTVTYSVSHGDWYATEIAEVDFGQRFVAHGPGGIAAEAGVSMPGRHSIANALLAIASLSAVGVDADVAARGVADCPGVPGRMQRIAAPGPVLGVVDYAHKPDSVAEVLAALRTRGRLICVIGAGGDRDRSKRPLMGAAAARGADIVIITDDNPRTEDPAAIRADLLAAAHAAADSARAGTPAVVVEVAGRRAAIEEAVRLAAAGDVIALLGKGHERGQELGGEVYPFDDREELATALGARFGPNAAGAADPEPARVGGPR
ncbi:MAG: UDP-N-acetylmuramoyl-L-alanyl-D-glutamate--2,6-diaminopimelate ligase [Dactylosporangium sp.]|nr:UDP-N-acetylmuramoyl-L-alanyl-D-glutamate--2,6-diaminopimelate ligase [Dactylosporangium sp.]